MYYNDSKKMDFTAKVITVYANVSMQNRRNLVILDQSAFYPTSGGQQHDTGKMTIEGMGEVNVVNVIKVGKCVLHQISSDVPDDVEIVGSQVSGIVDFNRRV